MGWPAALRAELHVSVSRCGLRVGHDGRDVYGVPTFPDAEEVKR